MASLSGVAAGVAGRPRRVPAREPGRGRQDVLDAAARLFSQKGYAATSTRAIADAAGVRQASLYYHFASKEALLAQLLDRTVQPSLAFVEVLADVKAPPLTALHALATYDVELLCSGSWNLGALYLLPELRSAPFAGFRADRARLRHAYASLVTAAGVDAVMTDMVFGLVESVIILRLEHDDVHASVVALRIADSCLRLLGVADRDISRTRTEAQALRLDG